MSSKLSYKIKSAGRSHLACQRCRAHKIKCSGERPKCRNCASFDKECGYPKRDRIVNIAESELLKLQAKNEQLEKELGIFKKGPEDQNDDPENSKAVDNIVLKDTFFQTTSPTDSSLYSFLDIDGDDYDQDLLSSKNALKYYYSDPATLHNHISGVLSLPEKTHALYLLNKAISLIGHEYYLFDIPRFLTEVEDNYTIGLKTDNPSWMCYFLMTLAIGEQYVNETLTIETPGIHYYNLAMKLFQGDCEAPTLQLVQTQLMIAFFHQGLNRSNNAFSYYGQAVRTALVLGLHRKSKSQSLVEKEKRRRLWWTCYIMDSIWAAKLGQPIHVQFDDITVEMEEITSLDDGFKNDVLKYNSQLAVIIADVMKHIYKPTSVKRISDLLKCLTQLSDFQQNLPANIKGLIISPNDRTSANLYLRLNQIVIITVRPLILSIFNGQQNIENTTEINQATKKCITAACSNISILEELRKIGFLSNFGFWDARYLFSSLLVLYMTGDSYMEFIDLGRKLNKLMIEAGNFSAIENGLRLKELDILFQKIKESGAPVDTHEDSIKPITTSHKEAEDVSPNTLLMDDISNTFSNINDMYVDPSEIMNLFHPLSKELPQDLYKNITSNLKSWDTFGI